MSKHTRTTLQVASWLLAGPPRVEKEELDLFPSLLSAKASFPSSRRSRRSRAQGRTGLAKIESSLKPLRKARLQAAHQVAQGTKFGSQVRGEGLGSWAALQQSGVPHHEPPAFCSSGLSAWQAPSGQASTDLTCPGRR